MIWSGIIRSVTFSFQNLCLYNLVYISSNGITNLEQIATIAMYNYLLLLYPLIITYIIRVNGPELMQSRFARDRMQALVS